MVRFIGGVDCLRRLEGNFKNFDLLPENVLI